MGCTESSPEKLVSVSIDKELKKEAKLNDHLVKVLLLGTGASGKTTISKQMRLLFLSGYSEKELRSFREPIFSSVLRNLISIVGKMLELGLPFDQDSNTQDARNLIQMQTGADAEITAELAVVITRLWKDSQLQKFFLSLPKTLSIDDGFSYFMDNMQRLGGSGYVPTQDDVLRCRVKTLGIHQTEFQCHGMDFLLVDVGGQRTERRKWIHCFEEVTVILYVVALSEYDLVCEEDNLTNRTVESLNLFSDVVNNKFFVKTNIVLFLNKKDLFEDKLKRVPLTVCFPEYTGTTHNEALEYIQGQFEVLNKTPANVRHIYRYVTQATDTKQTQIVWDAVADVLLKDQLKDAGFKE